MSTAAAGGPFRSTGAVGRLRLTPVSATGWGALAAIAVILLLAPQIFTSFWLSQILTQALWLGIAAVSLTFLSRYGGMVSLAQVGLYGIAGFTMANLVHASEGQHLGWTPWAGVFAGIAVAVLVSFMFGAISSRSYGIYFLMITLALTVIVYYFFAQVTQLSGFGGVRDVARPGFLGNPITNPKPLYYVSLGCSVAVYLLLRYVVRTPFGIALQGIRDDPPRMRSLGYNVPLHRTLAFTFGAFIASIAGVLSVWFNTQISPGSVRIDQAIAVLIIAVIGGLSRLEGAWIGAVAYTLIDYYSRQWTPTVGNWLGPDRFGTIIGVIFLVIVLVSPDGLIGIGQKLRRLIGPALGEPVTAGPAMARAGAAAAAGATPGAAEAPGAPAATGASGPGIREA
jgi:branched-chain amino acid transport system permease protein